MSMIPFGARERLDRMPTTAETLVVAREEVLRDSTDIVHRIESRVAAHRLLTGSRYRLTPRAAQIVALRPTGGTPAALVALLVAGQLVFLTRRARRPIAGSVPSTPTAPPAEPSRNEASKATSWIRIRVVHHLSGEPFVGVRLAVRIPSGPEVSCRTDATGLAAIHDIDPGVCDVRCPMEGARLNRTVAFVGMGAPPPRAITAPNSPPRSDWGAPAEWIAHVDEHHVQTSATLKSIAEANGFSWQALAEFNWGTSIPDQINRHLRDDVGCTLKTRDGMNYRFTSEDEPGFIYIPRPWWESGLATEQTHIIRVRLAAGFRLILENLEKLRIPEVEYEATLSDGSVRNGRLGRGGVALIKDPPPGPVEVRYADLDDIEAKSLAAAARKALDDRDPLEIHRLFRYPTETVRRAFEAYDRHYNDYHGAGLRSDLQREFFSDPDAELIFFGYMAELDRPAGGQPNADPAPAEEAAHA